MKVPLDVARNRIISAESDRAGGGPWAWRRVPLTEDPRLVAYELEKKNKRVFVCQKLNSGAESLKQRRRRGRCCCRCS